MLFADFLRRILFKLKISLRIYYSANYLVVQLTWSSGAVLNKGNFGLRVLATRHGKSNATIKCSYKNNIANRQACTISTTLSADVK